MKAKIKVLHPGLYSSIQDLGRFGFRKFGVPQSGVMDSYSAKMSNLLLNNSEEKPVLEITQTGPKLEFNEASKIAICGALINPKLNEKSVFNNQIIQVKMGDVLSFGKLEFGYRAYLGISGGFLSDIILNSSSWYEGITHQFRLQKGDELFFNSSSTSDTVTNSGLKVKAYFLKEQLVPVYKGPEFYLLSKILQKKLLSTNFTIDKKNNRMAVQLVEPFSNKLKPIITGPVLPGTVQLTPSGNLIVLMRDCQTTGGYPRILQLSEEGINLLSQKIAGDTVKFDLRLL